MRVQFSLRMLLIVMAGIGALIAVYRWPFSHTHVQGDRSILVHYRRNWNGELQKHGSEQERITASNLLIYEHLYVDGIPIQERTFSPPGVLREEQSVIPEGGIRIKRFDRLNGEDLVVEDVYREYSRQPTSEQWQTRSGVLLESIEFKDGEAVLWNGRPIDEELSRVFASIPDHQERAAWLAPGSPDTGLGTTFDEALGDGTYRIRAYIHQLSQESDAVFAQRLLNLPRVTLHVVASSNEERHPISQFEPSARLGIHELRTAHQRHCTLRCRYGTVCCVPISSQSLRNPEPTGIEKIRFAEYSPEASDWTRLTFAMREKFLSHAERIQDFFADTSLNVDASQVTFIESPSPRRDEESAVYPAIDFPHDSMHLRRRCDIFGLFLSYNNYRVEQQGNKLIVLPQ